ncbi:MAG: nickel pincer cofactor biosynthesis protein LarB [Syntrophomonadales bacterium]|jgi:NCAIR mutase (PurE)-related protein
MNKERLRAILQGLADQQLSVDAAMDALKVLPYQDLGFAKLDNHRALRDNFPEVIYCPGKTPREAAQLIARLNETGQNVIATRASAETYAAVTELVPGAYYNERSRLITVVNTPVTARGNVAVLTAGTADIPVAEEAALCLEIMGASVNRIFDVGVAGIHRLLDRINDLNQAQVLIVVAGMDGALASVVGGLTSRPVIAVPTSVGYGASFGGLSALLTMLNSCASGVGVVNIDNGFGAAALAFAILSSNR